MFTFTKVTNKDFALLFKWLSKPHIVKWWDPAPTWDQFQQKYQKKLQSPWQKMFVVYKDHTPIGYIQAYQCGHDDWFDQPTGTWGIDQYIGEQEYLGKGYGTQFIKQFVEMLFQDPSITKIIVDADPNNARAIRCYEKVGFTKVGVVKDGQGKDVELFELYPTI